MKSFLELKNEILECRYCKYKFGFEPNPIFWGNEFAKIVHISQAPSKNVHKTSKPFNDLSGQKLREWYQVSEEIFYNPDLFYITAIAHCFPGKDKNGGDIKPPVECAERWLLKELSFVKNRIYLIIGKEAANFVFPNKNYAQLIFEDQLLNNKPAFILPHPSPLNIKWFKDNPDFLIKRLPQIIKVIHKILEI